METAIIVAIISALTSGIISVITVYLNHFLAKQRENITSTVTTGKKEKKKKRAKRMKDIVMAIMVITFICTIISTGIVVFIFLTGHNSINDPQLSPPVTATTTPRIAPTNPDVPSVTISYPSNTDKVDIWEWVSGTSKNIPPGQELWIVVRWGSLYFPMYDRVQRYDDGSWQYNTSIGQENDGGKIFEIIAVLADGSAQAKINEWHQTPSDLTGMFPGMTPYDTITVTRK